MNLSSSAGFAGAILGGGTGCHAHRHREATL
jgi:hypothetical protein